MDTTEHYRKCQKDFLEYFNIPYPYTPPKNEWIGSDPNKILVLSDPHEPCGNERVYAEVLKHKDAGVLVVAGDLGDYYSKSRFRKTRHISFKDEVRSVFLRMEWMSKHWRGVRIMIGNHDNRPEKTIANIFAGNEDLLILTEQNLLLRISTYFPNVEIVGTQLDDTGINLSHIYQLGDIVFTHGELSRAQSTATLEYISRYLFRWKTFLNLKPYKVIAQAHNHQDMRKPMGDEFWFMLPTASDPYGTAFEYIWTPRMVGNPPQVGYTIFYQENGVTVYNKSHNYLV